jgi:multidrug efflux system outer membrane protein
MALVVSGCAMGPDFVRPSSTLPAAYAEQTVSAADINPLIEVEWWRHFNDPVLNDLMDKALNQNADIRAAVARVEQAEAAAREAGAEFLPQINGEVFGNRAEGGRTVDTATASVFTAYELDVWGRLRRSSESARALALASHYGRDAIRLSIAGLVANNYLALRAYDAQLMLSAESEASREATLKLVRTRVDAGLVSPLDLYQAQGALSAIQAQSANLRLQRALALHQLALLTGTPDLKVVPGDVRELPIPPVPPAGLPSSLVQGRPDVREAEATVVAANATIGLAKAGYFPRFTLTGSAGRESDTLSNLFSGGASTWSLGLAALMPILDFGRTSARVDQAKGLNKESIVAYQNTLQTAFKEVNDAIVGVRENAAGEAAQAARVEAAEKALKLAQLRYESGYSSYLEVLDAQRTSNDSLLAFVSTRQARLAAAVDLFKALGGGWKDGFVAVETAASP